MAPIRILHTSDWHLGRPLLNRKRYEEFEQFLTWLAGKIIEMQIDVLLVAGDVFDNSVPSNRAQELYYRFLMAVSRSRCRHVVITAGNHDSPSFLDAPREALRILNVHVVGAASAPAEEVLVLDGEDGEPALIVCAVPYLRDRDVRTVEEGETIADKDRKQIEGIRLHYRQVCDEALGKREVVKKDVPIVAMGHLFASGSVTMEEDGVRALYVGNLGQVGEDVFPKCIDYLALGHLHIPQLVKGNETRRYSGSPVAMGFGDGKQEKAVLVVNFVGITPEVDVVSVPRFRELESIRGDWSTISARLERLRVMGSNSWIEVVYEGAEVLGNLRERVEEVVSGSSLELLRIRDSRVLAAALERAASEETLEELGVEDVFVRLLDAGQIPAEQREELMGTYQEAVRSLHEEDAMAE